MKNEFRLRKQIITFNSLLTMVPVLIIALSLITVYIVNIRNSIEQTTDATLNRATSNMDEVFTSVKDSVMNIFYNETVQRNLINIKNDRIVFAVLPTGNKVNKIIAVCPIKKPYTRKCVCFYQCQFRLKL